MADKLNNAVITISSKEEKSGQYGPIAKIKDEKGLTYSVYKTKKDGTTSVAWEQLQELSLGDIVNIGYAEEIRVHPEHGKYTARTIRNFDLDIANGMANATQSRTEGQSLNLGHSVASQGRNYDQEGYEKCAWNYFTVVSNGNLTMFGEALVEGIVWDAFQAIKEDSSKRFSPLRQAVAKSAPRVLLPDEDLPVIQQEEPIDVSDIPFS